MKKIFFSICCSVDEEDSEKDEKENVKRGKFSESERNKETFLIIKFRNCNWTENIFSDTVAYRLMTVMACQVSALVDVETEFQNSYVFRAGLDTIFLNFRWHQKQLFPCAYVFFFIFQPVYKNRFTQLSRRHKY